MDTLRERLAEAADKAPTEVAPAAELWARGRRVQRLRAAAIVAAVLVVGAVSTGIGIRVVDGDRDGTVPEPAERVDIPLPIEYPVGEELPDLGETPGPLAAVWLVPRPGGAAPEVVGLVAETGTFGTLPIDDLLPEPDDPDNPDPLGRVSVVLSSDGRRIAYPPSGRAMMIVRDMVTGERITLRPEFEARSGDTWWVDATHLVGHVAGGSDSEAWAWEPGTAAKRVDYYAYVGAYPRPYLGPDGPYLDDEENEYLGTLNNGFGPHSCSPPAFLGGPEAGTVKVSTLCDVLYIGNEWMLGHWKDAREGNTTVVALDLRDFAIPPADNLHFDDPALRRLVVAAGAPHEVSLATDLVGAALKAEGGAS